MAKKRLWNKCWTHDAICALKINLVPKINNLFCWDTISISDNEEKGSIFFASQKSEVRRFLDEQNRD